MAVLTEGTVDTNAIIVGDWTELAVEYPIDSDTWLLLGNAPEGVLEIAKEDYLHVSTSFPRKTDLIVPIRIDMKFSARIEELHAENLRTIMGLAPNNSNEYVYIGALSTPTYFKFRARRNRTSDLQTITAVFWKAQSTGLLQIAGGDEAVSSPIEIMAVDDSAGAYGGSSSAPLGYIHIPAKTV